MEYSPSPHEEEDIHKEFLYERSIIEEIAGIRLSLIEAVGLRRITEAYMRKWFQHGSSFSMAVPYEEIPVQFFCEFYDMDPDTCHLLFDSTTRDPLIQEWFRRDQEKRHLL